MKRFIITLAELLIVAAFILGPCAYDAFAQEAKVLEVSRTDADEAKRAYDTFDQARKAFEAVRYRLEEKYKTADRTQTYGTIIVGGGYLRLGFECGIEFSNDFRFAIPKPCPASTQRPYVWTYNGASMATPMNEYAPLSSSGILKLNTNNPLSVVNN